MNSRQSRTLRVFMSIAVGAIAFCLTVPLVLLIGGILLGPLESDVLIPTELAILFLISILVGLTVGIFVGIKFHRYLTKRSEV